MGSIPPIFNMQSKIFNHYIRLRIRSPDSMWKFNENSCIAKEWFDLLPGYGVF